SRAEAQASATASVIPSLDSGARQTTHALAVLLGKDPSALIMELSEAAPIPQAPKEIPIGMPTDRLRRRPALRPAGRRAGAAAPGPPAGGARAGGADGPDRRRDRGALSPLLPDRHLRVQQHQLRELLQRAQPGLELRADDPVVALPGRPDPGEHRGAERPAG